MRRDLKFQLRDALRASGRRAGDIAVQSGVTREQMAELLRGRDGVTLHVLTAVCDRLSVNIELRAGVAIEYAPGVIRSLVDDVRERLQHTDRSAEEVIADMRARLEERRKELLCRPHPRVS